ncbi:hypothetical protein Tco_0805160 [Tanacetum coccineum]
MKTGLRPLNTARPVNTAYPKTIVYSARPVSRSSTKEDQGYVDSGCSRHMTGNMFYLLDFKEFDGGYVSFGGGTKGGRITGKGILKLMCDKKNNVLFIDTGCFVLSPDFKLADESHVLLKVPRKNNMYSVDMKNIVPKESLTCLVAKATLDESMLWHRRLGHSPRGDVAFLRGQRDDVSACKKLVGEVGASWRCLDAKLSFKMGQKERNGVAGSIEHD